MCPSSVSSTSGSGSRAPDVSIAFLIDGETRLYGSFDNSLDMWQTKVILTGHTSDLKDGVFSGSDLFAQRHDLLAFGAGEARTLFRVNVRPVHLGADSYPMQAYNIT